MAIVHVCRFLVEATRTVADGGDLPGTATSYYNIRAIERLLGPVVEWRDTFLDEMYPGGTTRLRHPAGTCKGSEPRSKPGFS
jgi:hypothetical protein